VHKQPVQHGLNQFSRLSPSEKILQFMGEFPHIITWYTWYILCCEPCRNAEGIQILISGRSADRYWLQSTTNIGSTKIYIRRLG